MISELFPTAMHLVIIFLVRGDVRVWFKVHNLEPCRVSDFDIIFWYHGMFRHIPNFGLRRGLRRWKRRREHDHLPNFGFYVPFEMIQVDIIFYRRKKTKKITIIISILSWYMSRCPIHIHRHDWHNYIG